MHVFLDFETRSAVDIRETGAWRYAADPTTEAVLLAGYFPATGDIQQWSLLKGHRDADGVPICPEWIKTLAADPQTICHAYNAEFEIAIWRRCLVERWGWPDIPRERWTDTAGLAGHYNLPRHLALAGKALDIDNKKLESGLNLIKELSIPQRAVSATVDEHGDPRKDSIEYLTAHGVELFPIGDASGVEDAKFGYWNEDPKKYEAFAKYNRVDTMADADIHARCPPYTGREDEVWALHQRINERGLPIDVEFCQFVVDEILFGLSCDAEIQTSYITGGEVDRPTQTQRIIRYIKPLDPSFGKSLAKDVVERWLDDHEHVDENADTPLSKVKALLLFRSLNSGSAVKKYQAALNVVDDDGRARGQFYYYGAATGRWAGRGIQPHNFYREAIPGENRFAEILNLCRSSEDGSAYEMLKEQFEAENIPIFSMMRKCVRGLIKAPDGSKLVVSDFAGIESRVLQWLAGAEDALNIFRAGRDMYVHTAARMYGLDYDSMMGDDGKVLKEFKEHRQIGKAAVLGLGYQMGAGRFSDELAKIGVDADAEDIVDKWRNANPLISDFEAGLWYRIQKAFDAVTSGRVGEGYLFRGKPNQLIIRKEYGSTTIELPSGRKLFYRNATTRYNKVTGWRERSYDDGTKHSSRTDTYGGKLVENAVQAISRDLLVESMLLAEKRGLYVIGHVHDEIIVEAKDEDVDAAHTALHECMTTVPAWAAGLPLEAETYVSHRYTK